MALLPHPVTRRAMLEMSASNHLHAPLGYGTVHGALIAGQLATVAVWCPPGVPKISLAGARRAVRALVFNASPVARAATHVASVLLSDVAGAAALVRERRRVVSRASRGHTWELVLLATVPEHRGRGLARMLLERQLHRCDEDGAAAWLETTDPLNPPIYERFGFVTVGQIDDAAWLPGLWVMRRPPRRA